MVSFNFISLTVLASAFLSNAAPTVPTEDRPVSAVDFQGTTVYYYTDTLNSTFTPEQGAVVKRDPDSDDCGSSSFDPAPAPYATVSDCRVLANYVYGLNAYWTVKAPGPVANTKIAWAGTCAFGASTKNVLTTWIGSTDIGDLINGGINAWQSGGVVASQGNMGCTNPLTGTFGQGPSAVFWALYRN